jgi:hypothetical protein
MVSKFSLVFLVSALVVLSSCGGSDNNNPMTPGNVKELNSGDFGPGGTFQHRFASAGAFPYHCIHHGAMTGTVQVNDAATDTLVALLITSSSAPFPAATVKTGGRVVWTNNTNMVHTVTSN